jgi:hypothetical protein
MNRLAKIAGYMATTLRDVGPTGGGATRALMDSFSGAAKASSSGRSAMRAPTSAMRAPSSVSRNLGNPMSGGMSSKRPFRVGDIFGL